MPAAQAMRGGVPPRESTTQARGRNRRDLADGPNFVALSLADLMVDASGAVVIQTAGEMLVIELSGYHDVIRRGIAPEGTMTQHFNVSGMDFCQFRDGTRIYYTAGEVRLVLLPELLANEPGRMPHRPTPLRQR
jgi:hypothetical protein